MRIVGRILVWLVSALALCLLVLFGPLLIAYAEYKTTGTDHVEELFKKVGIHEAMTEIYEPIIDFMKLD